MRCRASEPLEGLHRSGGFGATGALLWAADIAKSYRRGTWPRRRVLSVLEGASLSLYRREIVGLVGENGSGKSTLMRILVGSLARDGGEIERSGSLGYCPQEPILYERLTCDEHFELFATAYDMDHVSVGPARERLYEQLGFARWANARVDELSGGTRAKLNLALALLADPDILLLDEPYAGFDWETYQRFWALTAERRDAGRSVLIISHFINDESNFDRIYDLRDGRTVLR